MNRWTRACVCIALLVVAARCTSNLTIAERRDAGALSVADADVERPSFPADSSPPPPDDDGGFSTISGGKEEAGPDDAASDGDAIDASDSG